MVLKKHDFADIIRFAVGINRAALRNVAQFGRALRSGRRGRRFESCHSDFFN